MVAQNAFTAGQNNEGFAENLGQLAGAIRPSPGDLLFFPRMIERFAAPPEEWDLPRFSSRYTTVFHPGGNTQTALSPPTIDAIYQFPQAR